MKRLQLLGGLFAALLGWPTASSAQLASTTGECVLIRSGGETRYERAIGVTWVGGGTLFECPGNVTIEADSAVLMETQGLAEFIGSVRYADSTRVMSADWAQFQREQALITARGNVTLTDASTGTTIRRAPFMTYYQPTDTRPDGLIVIPSGRPEAILVRAGEAGAPPDTTRIDADQLNIYGDDRFVARGSVIITRADVRGTAAEAEYSGEVSELRLHGTARLTGEDYELSGDTIIALTDEAEQLREVVARGNGELNSDETEIQVSAPLLRITLADGEVERLVAVVPQELRGPPPGAQPADPAAADAPADPDAVESGPPRARAVSSEFTLLADSIDAVTPARQLERVTAVGRAFAERLDPDSLRAGMPELIAKDWVRGDTIVATFAGSTAEGAADERVIEQITAVGADQAPASALAMVRDEQTEGGQPGISYQVARWIQIRFAAGEIEVVEVDGLHQGLYMQPESAARALGARGDRAGGAS